MQTWLSWWRWRRHSSRHWRATPESMISTSLERNWSHKRSGLTIAGARDSTRKPKMLISWSRMRNFSRVTKHNLLADWNQRYRWLAPFLRGNLGWIWQPNRTVLCQINRIYGVSRTLLKLKQCVPQLSRRIRGAMSGICPRSNRFPAI